MIIYSHYIIIGHLGPPVGLVRHDLFIKGEEGPSSSSLKKAIVEYSKIFRRHLGEDLWLKEKIECALSSIHDRRLVESITLGKPPKWPLTDDYLYIKGNSCCQINQALAGLIDISHIFVQPVIMWGGSYYEFGDIIANVLTNGSQL